MEARFHLAWGLPAGVEEDPEPQFPGVDQHSLGDSLIPLRKMNSRKLVLGFAIGVELGLVFAPASGEKARARLSSRVESCIRVAYAIDRGFRTDPLLQGKAS